MHYHLRVFIVAWLLLLILFPSAIIQFSPLIIEVPETITLAPHTIYYSWEASVIEMPIRMLPIDDQAEMNQLLGGEAKANLLRTVAQDRTMRGYHLFGSLLSSLEVQREQGTSMQLSVDMTGMWAYTFDASNLERFKSHIAGRSQDSASARHRDALV